jgi:hypothetical protein
MVKKKKTLTLASVNKKVDKLWDLCSQFEDSVNTRDLLTNEVMKLQSKIDKNQHRINVVHNIWVLVIILLTLINIAVNIF